MQRTIVFFCLLLFVFTPYGYSSPQARPQQLPGVGPADDTGPGIPPQLQKDMQKKANAQRQADLKRDTDKLLKLSTELKEYVDKSNENVLSVDVLRRAEEIEKLAHSVRMKMKGDF